METIKQKITDESIYSAIEYINSIGDDIEVAKTYSMAVKKLYWADKGARNLVLIGHAGINHLLNKANEVNETDPAQATELKSWAKTIAYDVGANTWPGWNDEGVTISDTEMYAGLNSAKLNLKLGLSLDKPKDKIAIAHWLLGAHYLAAKNFDESANSFTAAINISKDLKDETSTLLSTGYLAIAKILSGNKTEGESVFNKSIEGLEVIGTKDSEFYVQQLKTALAVFSK